MLTKKFWRDAAERSVSTAAQAAILACGADMAETGQLSVWAIDPMHVLGFALGGALLTLLKSLAASQVSDSDSAAFTTYDAKHDK